MGWSLQVLSAAGTQTRSWMVKGEELCTGRHVAQTFKIDYQLSRQSLTCSPPNCPAEGNGTRNVHLRGEVGASRGAGRAAASAETSVETASVLEENSTSPRLGLSIQHRIEEIATTAGSAYPRIHCGSSTINILSAQVLMSCCWRYGGHGGEARGAVEDATRHRRR